MLLILLLQWYQSRSWTVVCHPMIGQLSLDCAMLWMEPELMAMPPRFSSLSWLMTMLQGCSASTRPISLSVRVGTCFLYLNEFAGSRFFVASLFCTLIFRFLLYYCVCWMPAASVAGAFHVLWQLMVKLMWRHTLIETRALTITLASLEWVESWTTVLVVRVL